MIIFFSEKYDCFYITLKSLVFYTFSYTFRAYLKILSFNIFPSSFSKDNGKIIIKMKGYYFYLDFF